jgi:uncharacterized membrane protein YdjX (TVP38/TMEM64 family)
VCGSLAPSEVARPRRPLFAGTLLGCLPNNFMAAHAGDHLSDLHSLGDLYSPKIIGLGLVVGCIALVPVWYKHRNDKRKTAAAAGDAEGARAKAE